MKTEPLYTKLSINEFRRAKDPLEDLRREAKSLADRIPEDGQRYRIVYSLNRYGSDADGFLAEQFLNPEFFYLVALPIPEPKERIVIDYMSGIKRLNEVRELFKAKQMA